MATLTASGINCSNGTLDGQYTGTTSNITTYPIGSFVTRNYQGCCSPSLLNATVTCYVTTNAATAFNFLFSGGAGTNLVSGTWRCRGYTTSGVIMVQRVA